jgi:hypothetical protein
VENTTLTRTEIRLIFQEIKQNKTQIKLIKTHRN